MVIGLLTVSIYLPFSHSLKEKRSEASSLKRKLLNKYNVSVIESAQQDNPQLLVLSLAALATDTQLANSTLDHLLQFIQGNTQGEMTVLSRELL